MPNTSGLLPDEYKKMRDNNYFMFYLVITFLSLDPSSSRYKTPPGPPPALPGLPPAYSGLAWSQKRPVNPAPFNVNSNSDAPQSDIDVSRVFLDESAARGALIGFVNGQCCYGKACAEECSITKIIPMHALHVNFQFII